MPFLGAHMSIAGGLVNAISRIRHVDGRSLQIFTKNQRQWHTPEMSKEEEESFKRAVRQWGYIVAAHCSYLINLASRDDSNFKRSVLAMADELLRVHRLDIPYLIIHPGSHLGSGVEQGLSRIVSGLDMAMELADGAGDVMILLETTAGQGTGVGSRFEELEFILEHVELPDRYGICFDTCHVFAAGYDLRTEESYQETMGLFEEIIGLDKLKVFHLNDSKRALGSKIDRHEHIGAGEIGLDGFRFILTDPRFKRHPMILETPKGKDLADDVRNLAVLRDLLG